MEMVCYSLAYILFWFPLDQVGPAMDISDYSFL